MADLFLSGTGGAADWRIQNDGTLTLKVVHCLRAGHSDHESELNSPGDTTGETGPGSSRRVFRRRTGEAAERGLSALTGYFGVHLRGLTDLFLKRLPEFTQ